MKRKSIIAALLSMTMIIGLLLPSCAGKKTDYSDLESFIKSNKEAEENIKSAAASSNMDVDIKGNDIIYSIDFSKIEGSDESTVKDPALLEALENLMDEGKSQFTAVCKQAEEASGQTGVQLIVNYTYGDEVLLTKTYTSAD